MSMNCGEPRDVMSSEVVRTSLSTKTVFTKNVSSCPQHSWLFFPKENGFKKILKTKFFLYRFLLPPSDLK